MAPTQYDVIIVGGGLAGLTSAIMLGRSKARVLLIEKKQYPFHKVCGEYVSNETLGFLKSIGFDPMQHGAAAISHLKLSTPSGKTFCSGLDMGGFGLSRYVLDEALYNLARAAGAQALHAKVHEIKREGETYQVQVANGDLYTCSFVIGSYGKRTLLDRTLDRGFMKERSGFMAVKYHLLAREPDNEIALHAFRGGYCGLVKIEEEKYNLCYLYKRDTSFTSVKSLEEQVLSRNPQLEKIFSTSRFSPAKPEVISEISFAQKKLVEDGVFMLGDTAGLIAPLCGNGMAMAIHSAKLLCDILTGAGVLGKKLTAVERLWVQELYTGAWRRNFGARMRLGRALQPLFLNPLINEISVRTLHAFPVIRKKVVESTHGKIIPH